MASSVAPNEPQMSEAASAMNVPATDPVPAQPMPEPPAPSMPSTPEPTPDISQPVMPENTMAEAQSAMTPPPTDTPVAPTMPDISAGQVLSDNLSSPVTTASMTPGAGQHFLQNHQHHKVDQFLIQQLESQQYKLRSNC
jgi:hypothetical protein